MISVLSAGAPGTLIFISRKKIRRQAGRFCSMMMLSNDGFVNRRQLCAEETEKLRK